jgi:peptide/nickel transport system substrate-binding protein
LTIISQRVVKNYYEQLFEYPVITLPNGLRSIDPSGYGPRFNPLLATKPAVVSSDGRTYTLYLRKGVKSRYGNTFTAADIKYSWERSFGVKVCGGGFVLPLSGIRGMDQFEMVDNYTYRIHLREDNYLLSRTVENHCGPPLLDGTETKKHATSDDPWCKKWVSLHDAGWGPYLVESWTPGQQIVLRAREDYYGAKPKIDRVVFKEIPSSSDRLALVISGEVDMADELLPREVNKAAGQPGVKVDWWPVASQFDALIHNAKFPPHDDRRVREALNLAIPHQEIIDKIYFGRASLWEGVAPAIHEGAIKIPRKTDTARAKELIKGAGVEGKSLELYYGTATPTHEEIAIALQTAYQKLGIGLDLKKLPDAVFTERFFRKEIPMALYRDAAFQPDVGYSLGLWYPSRSFFSFGQLANSSNAQDKADQAKIDELIVKGTQTLDGKARQQVWTEFQLLVQKTEQFGYLPAPGMTVVRRENVKGATYYPDNFYKLIDMDKV